MDEYAGELLPPQAWELLDRTANAALVDVRTQAEWAYVGIADLGSISKQPYFISWALFPEMKANPDFPLQMAAAVPDRETPLLFLCRSGVRSKAAAIAMTALGYSQCFNITHGFEGDADATKHRGLVNGWKMDGLPWVQG